MRWSAVVMSEVGAPDSGLAVGCQPDVGVGVALGAGLPPPLGAGPPPPPLGAGLPPQFGTIGLPPQVGPQPPRVGMSAASSEPARHRRPSESAERPSCMRCWESKAAWRVGSSVMSALQAPDPKAPRPLLDTPVE